MANSAALELILELTGNADKQLASIQKELQGTQHQMEAAQKSAGFFGNILAGATGGLITSGIDAISSHFSDLISSGISDARGAIGLMSQTQAVLTSTGNAAGVTAEHIAEYASSLSDATGKSLFGDDQIQQSENLLLTFTNIKGTVLDAATAISVDMAQALGGAPKDSAIQLGKALNDPIAGISALSRVGVTFDAQQKAQIKTMQDAGNVAGAQGIILKELNKEFGGSAAAAAGATGGIAQLKGMLGEFGESIGAAVLPGIQTLTGFLTSPDMLAALQSVGDTIAHGVGDAMTWLTTAAIPALVSGWNTIAPIIGTVVAAFQDAASYIGTDGIGAAISTLGADLSELNPTIGGFLSALAPVGDVIQNVIDGFQGVGPYADAISTAFQFISDHATELEGALIAIGAVLAGAAIVGGIAGIVAAVASLATPVGAVIAVVALLGAAWAGNWDDIQGKTAAAWAVIQPVLAQLIAWLSENIPVAIQAASQFWTSTLQPALAAVGGFISGTIIPILGQVFTWLAQNIPTAVQTVVSFWSGTLQPALAVVGAFITGTLLPILAQVASFLVGVLSTAVQGASVVWTNVLQPALGAVGGFINGILLPILSALANVGLAVVQKGAELLGALWQNVLLPALTSVGSYISATLQPVFSAIGNFINATVIPALNSLGSSINTTAAPALSSLGGIAQNVKTWISNIGGAVQGVIGWLSDLAGKINSIQIPSWLQGHSPPPLANWLTAIGDAAAGVAETMPGMAQSMAAVTPTTNSLHASMLRFFNDFGDAGVVFGDAFTALPPKVQAVIQQINAAGADGIGTLQNYFNGFDDAIQHLPPEMQDTVARLRAEFEGLPTDADTSMASLKGVFDRFLSDFGDWGQVFGPAFAALPAQIQGVIGQINDTLGSQGIGILQNYFNGFDDALAQLPVGVQDTVAQLRDQFTSLGDATAATSTDVQAAVDDMAAGVESSTSALHDSVFAFFDDFGDAGTILGDAFEKLPPQLQGVIEEISNTLGDQGIGALENYLNGFDDYLSQLPEDVQGFVKQLRADLSTIPDDVQQSTQSITDALKEQQQSTEDLGPEIGQLGGVVDETGTTVEDTVQAIQDGVPNAEDAGRDLALGVKSGMSSVHDELVDYAHHLVQDMIDEMRSTAQAASPSQATADAVGAPMAQGIAVGMESESGNLNESASTLVGDSVDAMAGGVSTLDDVGIPMIQGVVDGLIAMEPELEAAIGKLSGDSQSAFKQWLDDVHKLIDESFRSIIDQANDLFSAVGNAAKMFDSQRYADDVAAGYDKIAQLQDELTQNTTDQQAAQEALNAATQQYNQDQQDLIALQDQQKQNAKELADAQQKQTDLENQKAVLQAQIDSGQIDEATGKAQMKALDKQIAAQNDVVNAAQKAYNDTQKQIADTQKDITDQQQIQKDSQKDINTLLDEQRKKQEEYNTQLEKNNDLLYQQTALRQVQESEMSQIQAAQEEAAKIADPTEAAKYLQIQLDFYEKYYDLQAQMIKAGDNTQQIEYLKQQQSLLVQAHDAALEQLQYEMDTTKSTAEDVAAGTTATSDDAATRKTLDDLNNTIGSLNNILAKGIEVTVTQGHASGTEYAPGGWSWVGEKGPELMYVPQGSQIYAHGDNPSGGGASYSITVDARGASDPQAIEAAGYRGAKRALEEVGATAQIRKRAR